MQTVLKKKSTVKLFLNFLFLMLILLLQAKIRFVWKAVDKKHTLIQIQGQTRCLENNMDDPKQKLTSDRMSLAKWRIQSLSACLHFLLWLCRGV